MTDIEHALTQAAYSRSKAQGIPRRLFNQLLPHAVLYLVSADNIVCKDCPADNTVRKDCPVDGYVRVVCASRLVDWRDDMSLRSCLQ
jgi:hypothetical protein